MNNKNFKKLKKGHKTGLLSKKKITKNIKRIQCTFHSLKNQKYLLYMTS